MGVFDTIFGNNTDKESSNLDWNSLKELSQIGEIEEESEGKLVVIFKHSTRCGISRMALKQFEREYEIPEDASIKLYLLDLVAHREVSNKVAVIFDVLHESPQLLVIKNKQVVYHTSHSSISAKKLTEFI